MEEKANASMDSNSLDENILQGNHIAKSSSMFDENLYCHRQGRQLLFAFFMLLQMTPKTYPMSFPV